MAHRKIFSILLLGLSLLPAFARAEFLDEDPVFGGVSPFVENVVINGQSVGPQYGIARTTVRLVSFLKSDGASIIMAVCSGTLIARDLVLTAAHCVQDEEGQPAQMVMARDIGGSLESAILADQWVVNPSYGRVKDGGFLGLGGYLRPVNDLAVVHLSSAVGAQARIAELPESEIPVGGSVSVVIAGFGETQARNSNSVGLLHSGHSIATMMSVAGDRDHQLNLSGMQICEGDSGGPVYSIQGSRIIVIGVNSHTDSKACLRNGRAISVFSHLNWIRQAARQLRSTLSL